MSAPELTAEELATVARFEQAPDALGPCTCAHYGNASRCPHHTQEDYDLAEAAREAPDALGLREEVAEVLLRKFQAPETEWAKRDLMSDALADADALLPLIERREAEAAERALREAALPVASALSRRLLDAGHPPETTGTVAALVQRELRARADHIGGPQ